MNTAHNILIDANICHGKPFIRGTRTPVTIVLDALAAGDSHHQIQEDYQITEEDIRACIAFASNEVSHQTYVPLVSVLTR